MAEYYMDDVRLQTAEEQRDDAEACIEALEKQLVVFRKENQDNARVVGILNDLMLVIDGYNRATANQLR